jgi:putative DNA primase/helicase
MTTARNASNETLSPPAAGGLAAGVATDGGAGVSFHLLENVHSVNGKTVARCPACAEDGHDKAGDHLVIDAAGRFGCVKYPGPSGADHRRRIFALVGEKPSRPQAPRKTSQKAVKRVEGWADMQSAAEACTPAGHRLADVYEYPKGGEAFAAVARYENGAGKTFRQFHISGGAWTAGKPAEAWPLFLVDGIGPGTVYICEGEKKTLAGLGIGLNVTTSAGGSGGANGSDWRPLAGRDVCILPDNDTPGEKYAATVAGILLGLGCTVRILRLPGLPAAGDLVEYLEANPNADAAQIEAMAAQVAPEAVPERTPAPAAQAMPQAAPGLSPIEAAAAGTPYACTDLGNAERFAFMHRDSVRFDAARRVWLVWDGRRWKPDAALEVNALAAETARAIRLEAAAVPTDSEQGRKTAENVFKHAMRSEARDRLAAMLDVARAQPGLAVSPSELDRDSFLLNCENGTLDLRTGTPKPHDRQDLLTRLSPVAYEPGKCDPRFDAFIQDATGGDADLRRFIQKLCGYLLTGDTREEKAFFWYGGTGTGKSTLLEGMRAVLGDYARTINPAMLCKQTNTNSGAATPELAALHGCRLAAGSELESGQQLGEAFMKSLTGGEGITARHLYGAQFEFMPTFKIVLAVNH